MFVLKSPVFLLCSRQDLMVETSPISSASQGQEPRILWISRRPQTSMFQAAGHLKWTGKKLTQPMAARPEVKEFLFSIAKQSSSSWDGKAGFEAPGADTCQGHTVLTSLSWVMEVKVMLACTFIRPTTKTLRLLYCALWSSCLGCEHSSPFATTAKETGILDDFSTRGTEGSPSV